MLDKVLEDVEVQCQEERIPRRLSPTISVEQNRWLIIWNTSVRTTTPRHIGLRVDGGRADATAWKSASIVADVNRNESGGCKPRLSYRNS